MTLGNSKYNDVIDLLDKQQQNDVTAIPLQLQQKLCRENTSRNNLSDVNPRGSILPTDQEQTLYFISSA